MIVRLALRSLLSQPIRSAVLAGGFGLGVAVMAILLGVGDVVLDQAQSPALVGGGDVVVGGATGRCRQRDIRARRRLAAARWRRGSQVASPTRAGEPLSGRRARCDAGRRPRRDSESGARARRSRNERRRRWLDTPADRAWAHADAGGRASRASIASTRSPTSRRAPTSWGEWLYFNGRAGRTRFYLTFLAGPRVACDGDRSAFGCSSIAAAS